MNKKDNTILFEKHIEVYESLKQAVRDAGGDPSGFKLKYLKEMTVTELLWTLGQNNIEIRYRGCIEELENKQKEIRCPYGLLFGKDFDHENCHGTTCEFEIECGSVYEENY